MESEKNNNGGKMSFLPYKKKLLSVLFFNLLCLTFFVLNAQQPALTGTWVFDHVEEQERPLYTRDAHAITVFNSVGDVTGKTYFLNIPLEINFMSGGADLGLSDLITSEGTFLCIEYMWHETGILVFFVDESIHDAINGKAMLTTFSNVSFNANILKMQYDYAYEGMGGGYVDGFLTLYFRRP